MAHYDEDELTLYHYGEARRADRIEQHLQACEACAAVYRQIAGTLAMVGTIDVPERDERYGLAVWQRIRHDLPPQDTSWLAGWSTSYFRRSSARSRCWLRRRSWRVRCGVSRARGQTT